MQEGLPQSKLIRGHCSVGIASAFLISQLAIHDAILPSAMLIY